MNGSPTRYWVVPLSNFISHFRTYSGGWFQHPLRLQDVPDVLVDGTEIEKLQSEWRYDHANRLVTFEYRRLPAFIEPLDDYDDTVIELRSNVVPSKVTARAIGELPEDCKSKEEVQAYLPDDFLVLLALATGREVGGLRIDVFNAGGKQKCDYLYTGNHRASRKVDPG